MHQDLSHILRAAPKGGGRFVLQVPDGWQQDRGAYGGLTLGALARAVIDCAAEPERALRSLTGVLTAPVQTGPAEIEVQLLRRGSAVSTYTAALRQGGPSTGPVAGATGALRTGPEILAHVTVVLGRTRPPAAGHVDHRFQPQPPERPAFESLPALPIRPSFGPPFAQHFEYRSALPPPFQGLSQEPVCGGWLRPRIPPAVLEAPELIALADVWWPAIYAMESAPRPGGTVSFTAEVFPPQRPLDKARPFYHSARAHSAGDGFIVEHRDLWSEDGQLLVHNPQTFALIR